MAEQEFTENDLEKLFEKAGKAGAILALLHFDSYGRDKEVVRAALVELVGRISGERGVIYCRGEVEEVLETEDEKGKSFSTYTEVKVLFDNLDTAVGVSLKFGPIAVEILQPKELKLTADKLQNTLLNASSISQQFTTYFMSKLLNKEDYAEFQENLKKRVERGKEMIKGAQPEKEEKKP